ncbi:hypothetical protein J9089_003236 [Salmonella enterica]|nr:hypothetical protein [Salmonella enterica]EHI7757768.1 hypothetical protein [Salmonella enterica]EHI8762911.1 hypothetical protein [Salmonella enterica]
MKNIIAAIVSLAIGFGACYAFMDKTITTQAETIATLTQEVDELNNVVAIKESEYKEVYADKQRYFDERNAGVLFGMQLCKKMKDTRSCLMELAIKTNSTVDFKD